MIVINGTYYGQENPRNQLRAMLGSVRGHLCNLADGTTTVKKAVSRLENDVARLEELILALDSLDSWPDDDYSAHYESFNLEKIGRPRREVMPGYDMAVALSPANPWWNARRVTYLIQCGRVGLAQEAWNEALANVDAEGTLVSSSVTPGSLWLAEHFYYWVAASWLDAGYPAFSRKTLDYLTDEVVEACSRTRDLLRRIQYAEEAEAIGESVFLGARPFAERWDRPANVQEWYQGVALSRWAPGRVVSREESVVVRCLSGEGPGAVVVTKSFSQAAWMNCDGNDRDDYVYVASYGAEIVRVSAQSGA